MTQHTPLINIHDAEALAERYFSAEISEQEERVLRAFLLTEEGADTRFDELRATMSYLSVGRQLYQAPRRSHRLVAVAASLILALALGVTGWYATRPPETFQATVAGREISKEKATQLMFSQMRDMFNPDNHVAP